MVNRPSEYVTCPRCNVALEYVGRKHFHEGTSFWDFLGGAWGFLENREAFDLYVCTRCGRVEFFVAGVGEEPRSEAVAARNVLVETPPAPAQAAQEWNCPHCGARVPGTFEICWKCNAERELPPAAPESGS